MVMISKTFTHPGRPEEEATSFATHGDQQHFPRKTQPLEFHVNFFCRNKENVPLAPASNDPPTLLLVLTVQEKLG